MDEDKAFERSQRLAGKLYDVLNIWYFNAKKRGLTDEEVAREISYAIEFVNVHQEDIGC